MKHVGLSLLDFVGIHWVTTNIKTDVKILNVLYVVLAALTLVMPQYVAIFRRNIMINNYLNWSLPVSRVYMQHSFSLVP